MKQFAILFGLCILGATTWRLGTSLSSDALAMAVGVVFGVLAGVPMALLALASQRRQERRERDDEDDDARQTVNVYITNNDNRQLTINAPAPGGMPLLADRQAEVAAEQQGRRFVVVGEREEAEG